MAPSTTHVTPDNTAYKMGRAPAFVGLARKHNGGVYLEDLDGMTVDQALTEADMDYTIDVIDGVNAPHLGSHGVTRVDLPNHRITVRVDKDGTAAPFGYGAVKGRYTALSPRTAFTDIGQHILDNYGANVVAVGEYGDPVGAKNYVAFRLPSAIVIGGVDRHDLYLTLLNSNDGTGSLGGMLAPIRQDCTNQTTANFGKNALQRFTLRHTGNPVERARQSEKIMALTNLWGDAFTREANRMIETQITNDRFEEIVGTLIAPASRNTDRSRNAYEAKRDNLTDLFRNSPTNDVGRGTAYGAYNAFVEHLDWFGRPGQQAERIMDGRTDKAKEAAWAAFAAL